MPPVAFKLSRSYSDLLSKRNPVAAKLCGRTPAGCGENTCDVHKCPHAPLVCWRLALSFLKSDMVHRYRLLFEFLHNANYSARVLLQFSNKCACVCVCVCVRERQRQRQRVGVSVCVR